MIYNNYNTKTIHSHTLMENNILNYNNNFSIMTIKKAHNQKLVIYNIMVKIILYIRFPTLKISACLMNYKIHVLWLILEYFKTNNNNKF